MVKGWPVSFFLVGSWHSWPLHKGNQMYNAGLCNVFVNVLLEIEFSRYVNWWKVEETEVVLFFLGYYIIELNYLMTSYWDDHLLWLKTTTFQTVVHWFLHAEFKQTTSTSSNKCRPNDIIFSCSELRIVFHLKSECPLQTHAGLEQIELQWCCYILSTSRYHHLFKGPQLGVKLFA